MNPKSKALKGLIDNLLSMGGPKKKPKKGEIEIEIMSIEKVPKKKGE